MLLPAIKKK